MPLLAGMDYWDTIAPNSSFIFPAGQAISRTTYAAAFARWGTRFGPGDGSTTFNVPDKTGRVSAMMEAAASRLTSAFFGGDSTKIGDLGGSESQTLTSAQLPVTSLAFHGGVQSISVTSSISNVLTLGGGNPGVTGSAAIGVTQATITSTGNSVSNGTIDSFGGGNAHANVQPTIVCNYVIRII